MCLHIFQESRGMEKDLKFFSQMKVFFMDDTCIVVEGTNNYIKTVITCY